MCSGCESDVVDTVCGLCTGNDDALAMCSDVTEPPHCTEMDSGDAIGGAEELLSEDAPSAMACALLVAQHRANANAMTYSTESHSCRSPGTTAPLSLRPSHGSCLPRSSL